MVVRFGTLVFPFLVSQIDSDLVLWQVSLPWAVLGTAKTWILNLAGNANPRVRLYGDLQRKS